MWGSIAKFAGNVWHGLFGGGGSAPRSSGGSGGLTVKPITTQSSLSVKPIAQTPSVSVRPTPQTPGVTVRTIPQTPNVSVANSPAAQAWARQQAQAKAATQQGLLASVWRNTLGKAQNAFTNWNTSRLIHQKAAKSEAQFQENVKRAQDTHGRIRAQQLQNLVNRVQSHQMTWKDAINQANAMDKADSRLGDQYNSTWANLEQQRVQNPGGTAGAIKGFQNFAGGIFGIPLKLLNGIDTGLTRGVNTVRNVFGLGDSPARGINLRQAWNDSKGQPVVPNKFYTQSQQQNEYWAKRMPGLYPHGVKPVSQTNKNLNNFVMDPLMWLPGGNTARLGKAGAWLLDHSGFAGKGIKGAANFLKNSPVGRLAAKATAESKTVNQAWLDNLAAKMGKKNVFEGRSSTDLNAYQDFMQGKKVNWEGVDRKWVEQTAAKQRNLFDSMHLAETNAGLKTGYRKGYLPTKQKQTDNLFSFLRFAGKGKGANYLDAAGLNRAETFRIWEHMNAMKASGQLEKAANVRAMARFAKTGNATHFMPGEYNKFAKSFLTNKKLLQAAPNRRFLSTDTSTLRAGLGMPERRWKQAVLKYNPAWYVHNLGWNIPASFMAGGARTAAGYAKMLRKGSIKNLPSELTDGAFGGLGGAVEKFSRGAAYHASLAKGMSKDQAVANVNKYLFDYGSHKNWEKPFRAVFPFWSWQKNFSRLLYQLPFDNPRSAATLNAINNRTQQELAKLPPDQRKTFQGQLYIPGKGWTTSAFTPFLDQQVSNAGVNPWLSLAQRMSSGQDYFGRDVSGESNTDTALSVIPQGRFLGPLLKLLNKNPQTKDWLATSGMGKETQGLDNTLPNYDPNLDYSKQAKSALKSYFGIPSFRNFDPKKYTAQQRYTAFTDAYFKTDWAKEYPNGNDRNAARAKLAKQFGFDLQKDIYNGKWAKNDTEATQLVKAAKENFWGAEQQNSAFWKKYYTLDKAGRRALLDANPQYKNPNLSYSGSKGSSKYAHTVTTKSGKTFTSYKSPAQERAAKIAWAYKNLPPDVRTGYLKKAGLTDPAKANWTNAQWTAWLKANGKDPATKLGIDLTNHPELGQNQIDTVNKIIASFQPTVKERRAVKWARPGSNKRIAFKPKNLTFKA